MKAIVTVGISASGKSSWAEEFTRNRANWKIIERDMIRFPDGKKDWANWKWKKEKQVTVDQWNQIETAALMEFNIIISDTNLNTERRNNMVEKLKVLGFDVEVKMFEVTLQEAVIRDNARKYGVGEEVIFNQWLQLNKDEVQNKDGELVYLFDIDGCVAINESGRGWYDWNRVGEDSVNTHVMEVAKALNTTGYGIIFFSARDEVCRPETEEWLSEHFGSDYELFMRDHGSMVRDSEMKEKMFRENIEGQYNVIGVFDDRPQVIKECWMKLGLKTFSVGNPYKSF